MSLDDAALFKQLHQSCLFKLDVAGARHSFSGEDCVQEVLVLVENRGAFLLVIYLSQEWVLLDSVCDDQLRVRENLFKSRSIGLFLLVGLIECNS